MKNIASNTYTELRGKIIIYALKWISRLLKVCISTFVCFAPVQPMLILFYKRNDIMISIRNNDQVVDDEAEDSLMTPIAFEYVVKDLKLAENTKKATSLVLVEKLTRKEVRELTGISSDTLSRALGRIKAHMDDLLQTENLVMTHHITLPELADGVASTEALIIEARMGGKKARKKSD